MSNYPVTNHDMYTQHGIARHTNGTLALRDSLDDYSKVELSAMIASGEYFQTLASTLDQIIDASNNVCRHPELYKIIKELLYMQQHYNIHKK